MTFTSIVILASTLSACGAQASQTPRQESAGAPTISTGPSVQLAAPATSSAAPATAQAANSKDALTKSHQIKAGQTDEQTSANIIHELSNWGMAGADQDAYDKWTDSYNQKSPMFGKSIKEICDDVAAEQREIYAPALFGPNYQADPTALDVVKTLTIRNSENICLHLETYTPIDNPKNIEPWNRTLVYTELFSTADNADGRKLSMGYTYRTNPDKNKVGSDPLNGKEEMFTAVLKQQGGIVVLTAPHFANIVK